MYKIVITVVLGIFVQSCVSSPITPSPITSRPTITPSPVPTKIALLEKSTPTSTTTPLPEFVPPPVIIETGEVWINPIDGSEMAAVPAGEFLMGNHDGFPWEGPTHMVYIDSFYIDKFEISNAQYRRCIESGNCVSPKDLKYYDDPEYAHHPVVYVDWNQAKKYCAWARKRLPTEAEWERAARGVDERIYPWGDEIDCSYANYKECGGHTVPEGSFPAGISPFGVLDMAGNVWEWVIDAWQEDYYQVSSSNNPQGPSKVRGPQDLRVFRGGSWTESPEYLRSSYRSWYESDAQYYNLGFRCVIDSP